MAKRFTDTDLWKKQRWFKQLSPEYKLAFIYIKDQCNHAGIWKVDCFELMEDTGLNEFDLSVFISKINIEFDKISGQKVFKERIFLVNSHTLWLTGFIQYQYEGKDQKVNQYSLPVSSALKILNGYLIDKGSEGLDKGSEGLDKGSEGLDKGSEGLSVLAKGLAENHITLSIPLDKGLLTPKDKDKDKDIDNNTLHNKVKPNSEFFLKNKIKKDGSEFNNTDYPQGENIVDKRLREAREKLARVESAAKESGAM
jgi:hypothetical protein